MTSALISILFLSVGLIIGWLGAERYMALMQFEEHEFENLFHENPHPEIYDSNGDINRGEYMLLTFDLGYDPSEFDEEDICEG